MSLKDEAISLLFPALLHCIFSMNQPPKNLQKSSSSNKGMEQNLNMFSCKALISQNIWIDIFFECKFIVLIARLVNWFMEFWGVNSCKKWMVRHYELEHCEVHQFQAFFIRFWLLSWDMELQTFWDVELHADFYLLHTVAWLIL